MVSAATTRWIPTHDQTGYISSHLDACTERFIARAAMNVGPALELGAGYGFASLRAIAAGAKTLTVTDPCATHLENFIQELPTGHRVKTAMVSLPDTTQLPAHHYDAVLVSRVLHFFDGAALNASAQAIGRLLRAGGRAYIICDSIHAPIFAPLELEYRKRRSRGMNAPGYFAGMHERYGALTPYLPDSFHFFEMDTLLQPFVAAGMQPLWSECLARPDYPPFKIGDGREAIGVELVQSSSIGLV